MNANLKKFHVHSGTSSWLEKNLTSREADPVTTQIVRFALHSAANQMKRTAIRTSFSSTIYEALDFAVVLYDRQIRLLAQAPTLPAFTGTMSFCIEAAVKAIGGESALNDGDVIIYNVPYGTGSHAQDCAIVIPVFTKDGVLVGYAANKAHWMDIGAKAPYCTDTTDVFQEGVVIPGIKLFQEGVRNHDLFRMVIANCRFPKEVEGDLNAQVASCHVGARELLRVIERFGYPLFQSCVERMFEHSERAVRRFIEALPDGKYSATCHMDNNGLNENSITFDVTVIIRGSEICMDFSDTPNAQAGPVNCPFPSTVSLARVTLAMIAGSAHEIPNEGSFQPLQVITRPGSMFHPVPPQPCYMYGWPLVAAMEGLFKALAEASGGQLPSGSAGDIAYLAYYGRALETGTAFVGGGAMPVGQGALPHADGAILFVPSLAHSQTTSPELQEAKTPVRFEKWEITPDSAGPGEYRGGSGWEFHYTVLQDVLLVSTIERTKVPGWGQRGGLSGQPNRFEIDFPDGRTEVIRKVTDMHVPAGSRLRVYCGGGGGYGLPAARNPEAVKRDLLSGIITIKHAHEFYSHALNP